MAPRSRGRPKKDAAGNARIDAALDAMRPLGFDKVLVRKTVYELLDVYGGTDCWFFIEEASYKLLIDTLLAKQETSLEEKNAKEEEETETPAAALTTAISEAGSSNLVAAEQSSLLISDGLNSAPQTSCAQNSASHDGKDLMERTETEERGIEGSDTMAMLPGPENKRKPVDDDGIGNNKKDMGEKNVERRPMIECENVAIRRRGPCYGWISGESDTTQENDLIHLPVTPLPQHIQRLLEQRLTPQSATKRKRSRWDVKPGDTT